MKKKLMAILLTLCLAITMCALVACNDPKPTPEGGAWYAQAKVSGGTATLTFTSDTEWKLDCKGTFLSDDWNPWQSGTYKFDGKPGTSTLHMTATKESPNTFIKDKAVGEEALYEPTDGEYAIVFDVNGDDTTFSFKPPQDGTKPDGSTVETCTQHVDENGDGTCDKCGEDMPQEATVQLALNDTQTSGQVTAYGKLELMTDKTWAISIAYVQGGDYTKTASGTWEMAVDYSKITLTVTEDTANVLENDTYDIALNAIDPQNILYSVNLSMTIPQVGTLNFAFSNAPKVQSTLTATVDGKYAKIELLDNNTWKLYMSYYAVDNVPQGYTETASGTWAFVDADSYNFNITLTVVSDTANALAEDTYTLTVNGTTYMYSGTIHITVSAASVDADFAFTQVTA